MYLLAFATSTSSYSESSLWLIVKASEFNDFGYLRINSGLNNYKKMYNKILFFISFYIIYFSKKKYSILVHIKEVSRATC
jgi:hypothetical protein